MLSVEHVTKRYGAFTALEDISLTFSPGVYGLLGPNGAGKTTLMKLLATLLFPTKGQILWDGEDILALGAEYRGLLGYLPQQFGYYPNYTPRQFLRYVAALQCVPKGEAEDPEAGRKGRPPEEGRPPAGGRKTFPRSSACYLLPVRPRSVRTLFISAYCSLSCFIHASPVE